MLDKERMSFVLEKLYLGGIDEASQMKKLQQSGVSHILTVDIKPLALESREGFEYKYVHALDVESFDLLPRLPDCIEFICQGREAGGVLVHCHAGQSRSATVVLAYLMQKMGLCLSDALLLLRKQRAAISPNPGFVKQLELFEAMGNTVDVESQVYKVYTLSRLADTLLHTAPDKAALLALNLAADPVQGVTGGDAYYKCRKCRRALFKQSALLPHPEGLGEVAFSWHGRKRGNEADVETAPLCQKSYFIEPVQWMAEDLVNIEGKLSCPKCRAKLGSFKWTGEQCPCGRWITPAFHIQTNKVDPVAHRPVVPVAQPTVQRFPKPTQSFILAGTDDRMNDGQDNPMSS